MADNQGLLSQSEIDALLATMASAAQEPDGNKPAKDTMAAMQSTDDRIKLYDFRRPDRFSKEQMRALRMIHETWARRVTVSLSAYLRGSVEVSLADIDQGMYASMAQQLGIQGLYYIIGLSPLPGHFMLYLSMELASAIVDRVMGGPGLPSNTGRSLTDLEIDLMRGLAEKMLNDLREAWAGTAAISPRVDDTSMNLLLVPIALPADAIVWVTFEVRVRGIANGMILGLPYPVLKPIAGQLSPYTWMSNSVTALPESAKANREEMQSSLKEVTVPVSVLLGTAEITFQELATLQPGDILSLDTPTDAMCQVLVNGSPKYLGRPGIRQRRMAVQIEQIVEPAVDFSAAADTDIELLPAEIPHP